MTGRALLGAADVDDEVLAAMAADLLGHDRADVAVLDTRVALVAYDLPAITTAGRYWVSGTARTTTGEADFRLFVKHVQAWHRHAFFQLVPEEHRAAAAASVPWRTEHLAYASDLAHRLPAGLRMPRALGVFELPDDAAAVWLEEVVAEPVAWDTARYARAAYLLGRMAASPRVAPLADVGGFGDGVIEQYAYGRLQMQVVPALLDDGVWRHPAIAAAFGASLRDRLRATVARIPALCEELAGFPYAAGHGDASPNNLLPGAEPGSFVLIDYGFWGRKPVGFDLGQLLVGEVQLGRRSPDLLAETDEAITAAYHRGLVEEGMELSPEEVRRAHALQVLLFTGLSALPFDELESPPERLWPLAEQRAALAAYCLDLVEATR